jgi:hypothetical protein
MTTTTNYARSYCATIAEELENLNTVLNSTPGETLYNDAIDYLELDHVEQGDELITYLNETVLEITKQHDDDGEPIGYVLLRTCGGPRCEIRRDTVNDGDNFYIDTWDGSEYYSERINLRALAFNLDEMLSY